MAKSETPFAEDLETIASPNNQFEDDAEWLNYPGVGEQLGGVILELNSEPSDSGKHFMLFLRKVDSQDVADSEKGKLMLRKTHFDAFDERNMGPGDKFLFEGLEEIEFDGDDGPAKYVSQELKG